MTIRTRALNLSRVGAFVGLNQLLIQGLGFVSALLIIRFLPADQYAIYTLATSFLLTALGLADGGVVTGVMSEGGKVWSDRKALANVVATGQAIRKMFAPWAALACIPAMLWVLRRHGADWGDCLLITSVVTIAFLSSLTSSIFVVPLQLRQELGLLQRVQLSAALMRTGLVAAGVVSVALAASALAANAVTEAWTSFRLRRIASRPGEPTGTPDGEARRAILRVVGYTLPGVIYYGVSGQLTIWLLSIFGTTEGIAQVGALGRLGAALGLFSSLLSIVVVPRFARLPNERSLLLRRYWEVFFAVVGLTGLVYFVVWRFPETTLSLLGPKYKGLHSEALLMALSCCLGLIAGAMSGLAASRAMLLRPAVGIPIGLAANVFAIAVSDVSTVMGVLTMTAGLAAFSAVFQTATGAWLLLRKPR